jgi:hypothetical protein
MFQRLLVTAFCSVCSVVFRKIRENLGTFFMAAVSEKQLGDALLAIGQALHSQDERLAELEAAVLVLKGFLATVLNPSNPAAALAQIEAKTREASERNAGAEERRKVSEALDLLKMIEKHGGPGEA